MKRLGNAVELPTHFHLSDTKQKTAPMKQNYLIAPLIAMAAFSGYYVYRTSQPQPPRHVQSKVVDEYAQRDGRKEAESLLAAEKFVLIETGPVLSWDKERREIAQSKYGVELRRLEDLATEGFARYVDAFNRVMRPHVLKRHGRGFFDTLHKEAIALHESRAPQKG